MKVIIIGNGPSVKKIHNYGFNKFVKEAKNNGFILICMNKILRYFKEEKITDFPQYYVAGDTLVNIQMYDEIIEFVDLFEHNYIAIPLEISDKYMIKGEDNLKKVEINKENDKVIDKDQVNKQIKYLKNKENVVSCIHSTTGKTCLKMAIDLKPESIYLIGMDENYSFGNIKSSTTMKTDIVDTKNDYFFPNYIKENEIISWAPSFMRVKEINNVIDKSDIKIFNLSEESHLNGLKSLSWEEFLKKYI